MWPDTESDRARFQELRSGDYGAWGKLSTGTLESAGQHELLNWACLLGAMNQLGNQPEIVDFIETMVCTSNKCMALFKP